MLQSELIVQRTELIAEHGVVAGGDMREAEAGVHMLQAGGNAIDAVVAAAFTGFVVEPASCGVGGYGRLAIYLGARREFVTVDHYVRAPLRATPKMFTIDSSQPWLQYNWPRVVGRRNEWGHLAAAVPGAVAGLCAAHEQFGRLPLAQVLEPAISIAEAGLPVTSTLVNQIANRWDQLQALPHAADLLLPNGSLPKASGSFNDGDRIDFSDLAKTLRRIAREGAAGFYTGPVAEAIEREVTSNGGILSTADLAAYRPKILREQPARYHSWSYVTAYDQVGYEILNILDHFDLPTLDPDGARFFHLMAEAFGHAYADNMAYYGDPEHTRSPANGLASRGFAAERAGGIRMDRAAPRPIAPGDPWPYDAAGPAPAVLPAAPSAGGVAGTSQMAAADNDGNLATLCTSLTSSFGSVVLVPGTGIFLNNSMQNFDPRPDRANCISPGKMPIFGVPTVAAVSDDGALFGACGSGGYRITSSVLHTMLHTLDFGMAIQDAVDHPRIFCQAEATYVDDRIPSAVRDDLAALGHQVISQSGGPLETSFGRVNAIRRDPATALFHAGSGPALSTGAAGF